MEGGKSDEILDLEVGMERVLEDCRIRCADLEKEMRQNICEFECLERKFRAVMVKNLGLVKEFGIIRKKYDELIKKVACRGYGNNLGEGGCARIEKEDAEMVKRQVRLSGVGVKQMNEVTDLKDRSSVPTSSLDLQAENTVSGSKATIHIAAGKIASPQHCVEERGSLFPF